MFHSNNTSDPLGMDIDVMLRLADLWLFWREYARCLRNGRKSAK